MTDQASLTCPRCGRTTWHPMDVREGYCGACHDWPSLPVVHRERIAAALLAMDQDALSDAMLGALLAPPGVAWATAEQLLRAMPEAVQAWWADPCPCGQDHAPGVHLSERERAALETLRRPPREE